MTVRLLRHLVAGLLLGIGLGTVARGFMALLTEDPQFSWEGTAFILGVFAVAGLVLAAAHFARLRRGSRWWKLVTLPAVLLFFGPGMLLAPAVVGLSLAASRRGWVRAVGVVVLAGSIGMLALLGETADEPFTLRTAAGFVVMYAVCAVLAAGARLALTGWEPKRSGAASSWAEAQPGGGDDPRDSGERRPTEDPLDLDDRRVEERLGVGLVGQ